MQSVYSNWVFACFFISVKGVINMIMGKQMVFLSLFFLHLHELVRRGGGEEMTGVCVDISR